MTLVLLPGMMCDARLFKHMPAHICLGISQQDTVAALAADVLRRAPASFALGGLSMGGIVAMEVIRQAPERVTRLCLMDTNCEAESEQIKATRQPQIDKALAGALESVMRNEMKPNYLANGPRRTDVLDVCMDMALGLGPQVFARQSAALRDRPDQKETLKHWRKPTLILTGAQDRLCPLHRHELMCALIPNATLSIIEDAGHLPPLERPTQTHAALMGWLQE